jgi:hypothetical protein
MLYVTNKNNKKEPFGIVGSLTVLTDSNSNVLFVGDIVKVTHKPTGWSRLRMVCYKDFAFIQGLSLVSPETIKDFTIEKVIDNSILTDGFQLYDTLITSKLVAQ